MEQGRKNELVEKYRLQMLSVGEERELEMLIEQGAVELEELGDLAKIHDQVNQLALPEPGSKLDDRFYQMVRQEKKSASWWRPVFSWQLIFGAGPVVPRLAGAALLLLLGVAVGYWVRPLAAGESADITHLSREVTDLKEMMMLSLLEKESATDRLKAVSLTEDMDQASQKVTHALIETLNNDSNVNVRLAALEALTPYARAPHVREALVRAIAHQDSPLVQVALAELMAGLQVKSSVKELQKILKDENTPPEIKHKIQESINIII